jgi:ribosomal protein S8
MEITVPNAINAAEARKITDTNVGNVLHEELAAIFTTIKQHAEANCSNCEVKSKISAMAQKVLKDAGYIIKDESYSDQREGDYTGFRISW